MNSCTLFDCYVLLGETILFLDLCAFSFSNLINRSMRFICKTHYGLHQKRIHRQVKVESSSFPYSMLNPETCFCLVCSCAAKMKCVSASVIKHENFFTGEIFFCAEELLSLDFNQLRTRKAFKFNEIRTCRQNCNWGNKVWMEMTWTLCACVGVYRS